MKFIWRADIGSSTRNRKDKSKGRGKGNQLQVRRGPGSFQEVETPRISRQTADEGGKIVSPTHRPPLPPSRSPWY